MYVWVVLEISRKEKAKYDFILKKYERKSNIIEVI